jgi:hypothetical protein
MSTHASITVVYPNKTAASVYVHSDGYYEHTGKMLLNHYNSLETAGALMTFGALSFVAARIYPTSGAEHNRDTPEPGVCIYFGRDCGEDSVGPNFYLTEQAARNDADYEYNYLFKDGIWYSRQENDDFEPLSIHFA